MIAPSFGDIFRTNSIKTGLAPIAVAPEALTRLRSAVERRNQLTVDLEALAITHPDGLRIGFDPEEDKRRFFVSPKGIVVVPKGMRLAG